MGVVRRPKGAYGCKERSLYHWLVLAFPDSTLCVQCGASEQDSEAAGRVSVSHLIGLRADSRQQHSTAQACGRVASCAGVPVCTRFTLVDCP